MTNKKESSLRFMTQIALYGFDDCIKNRIRLDDNAHQILEAIECLANNMQFQDLSGETLYRARVIDTKDIKRQNGFHINEDEKICTGFNEGQSGRAPECIVKAGRINHEWESIWYLANDIYTAMAEVRPGVRESISLATYSVADNSQIKILNFTNEEIKTKDGFDEKGTCIEKYDLNELYVGIQEILTLPAYNERTYYVSNIVIDILKKTGISGVKYKSFYGPGDNIALWNINDNLIKFCGSKVFLNYCSNNTFIEITNNQAVDYPKELYNQMIMGSSTTVQETQKMFKELIDKEKR